MKTKKQYLLVDGALRSLKEGRDLQEAIRSLTAAGKVVKVVKGQPPSISTMEKWMDDGIARTTDGCRAEPDGSCPHGHLSWLMVLGCI